MRKKRLVALDVDRTLLTDDYRVLPEISNAVAQAREDGVLIVLATARAPEAVRHVLTDLGEVDGVICCGGALTMKLWADTWQVVPGSDDSFVPMDLVHAVVRQARELDMPLAVYTMEGAFVDQMEPVLGEEFRLTGMNASECDLLDIRVPVAKFLAIARPGQIPILHEFRQAFDEPLSCVFSHGNLLEVMQKGVSKGRGLISLTTSLGVDTTNVVAIGDSENDLSMFAVAGLAIAMGNGSAEVRAAADWVTSTNNEAGVAAALFRCRRELWEA